MERTFLHIDVKETSHNREYWASRPFLGDQAAKVRSADILIVPWEDFREGQAVLFPQGTSDFFLRLQKAGADVALAVDSKQYAEIALHAKAWRIPTLVVSALLLPALAGFLGDVLHDAVTDVGANDTIEMKVIVEGSNGRCISVDYKGAPSRALDTILDEAERCLPEITDGSPETDLRK